LIAARTGQREGSGATASRRRVISAAVSCSVAVPCCTLRSVASASSRAPARERSGGVRSNGAAIVACSFGHAASSRRTAARLAASRALRCSSWPSRRANASLSTCARRSAIQSVASAPTATVPASAPATPSRSEPRRARTSSRDEPSGRTSRMRERPVGRWRDGAAPR
jgi:hypothetical protein